AEAGQNKVRREVGLSNHALERRPLSTLPEDDEPYLVVHGDDSFCCLDQHGDALLAAKPPGPDDDPLARMIEERFELFAALRVGALESTEARSIGNDAGSARGNPSAADLASLRMRYAHDMIHVAQVQPVDGFVDVDLAVLTGPAARHGDRGDPVMTSREAADEIGLVTVAEQPVGARPPKAPRQFEYRPREIGRVAPQGLALEAVPANVFEEFVAASAFGERQEDALAFGRQVAGQANHLPLRP